MLFIRRLDDLGRLVIPKEIRQAIGATAPRVPMLIDFDGKQVVVKKADDTCKVCGSEKELIARAAGDAYICRECLNDFNNGMPKF